MIERIRIGIDLGGTKIEGLALDGLGNEIARLRIVLSYDADNLDLAAKIAQLALSIGQHETTLEMERDRGISITSAALQWLPCV